MSTSRRVVLLRTDNSIVVDTNSRRVNSVLADKLRYFERKFFHGREKNDRVRMGLPPFEEIEWQCYSEDHKGRIGTSFGFVDRIVDALEPLGYDVRIRWASEDDKVRDAERRESVFKPRWDRIDELLKSGFEFRHKQKKCLRLISEFENGRVDCPPGWGKGTVIMLACVLLPKARIAVVTKNVAVLQQRLYPELALNLPSVGCVGGGKKIKGRRVMCYTADSLHHVKTESPFDLVFVDEGHQACADDFAEQLGMYFPDARMWALSATWDMRLDNKDMRAEAMFGPIRLKVHYKDAVAHGMVVPIEVHWTDVITDINPCSDMTGVPKKQRGIWSNDYRNSLIAADARKYDDDTQVLITVETVEHALYLHRELPEFSLVYSGVSVTPKDWRYYREIGLIDEDFREMTPDRKQRLTRRFEKGSLKKAIATPVWNVGVNFKQLQVLIRADAGGSPINDTQIPGRASRISDGKEVAILHDYRDQFDHGFRQKASGREASYARNEWEQHFPKNGKPSRRRNREDD